MFLLNIHRNKTYELIYKFTIQNVPIKLTASFNMKKIFDTFTIQNVPIKSP